MSRPTQMFRGKELSRLMLLATLAAAGWVFYFLNDGPRAAPPPPPPRASEIPQPIPPDDGPEFLGIQDKVALSFRDNPAYAKLLRRVRTTSAADLGKQSRREVLFAQILSRPDLYRGVPIRIDGTALRVMVQDHIDPSLSPRRRLYEAWAITKDSQGYPYCLVFEDPPKNLAVGDDLDERIFFDGYFLKLMAYQARNHERFAPLLIGRLTKYGPSASARPLVPLPKGWDRGHWVILGLAVLTVLALIRFGFRLRRQFAPTWRPPTSITPIDQIDPDSLASWLDKSAQESSENWESPYKPEQNSAEDWGATYTPGPDSAEDWGPSHKSSQDSSEDWGPSHKGRDGKDE